MVGDLRMQMSPRNGRFLIAFAGQVGGVLFYHQATKKKRLFLWNHKLLLAVGDLNF